jgi:hypothetical protein
LRLPTMALQSANITIKQNFHLRFKYQFKL